MVTIVRRVTMANAIGNKYPYAIAPAPAMTPRISCVAYAVEESASEAKTANPTTLPIVWWGASAVDKACPINHERQDRGGLSSESRVIMDVCVKSSGLIIMLNSGCVVF